MTSDGERNTIIIDPATYHYLGSIDEAVHDYHRAGDAGTVKAGTRIGWTAQLATGIVDKPGQRTN